MRNHESGPHASHQQKTTTEIKMIEKNDREKGEDCSLGKIPTHPYGEFWHFICFNIHEINFCFKQEKGPFFVFKQISDG